MNTLTPNTPTEPASPAQQRGRRLRWRIRQIPASLLLLILVTGLESLAWNLALPAFQGPDESTHFAYIQYLGEHARLPSATSGNSPVSTEMGDTLGILNLRATQGDLTARPAWSSADLKLWRSAVDKLPAQARGDGPGPNPIAKNPPLYYIVMAIPYRLFTRVSLLRRLFILRLINSIFFIGTVILTWLIAGELFGSSRWKQTLAAGMVALEPQLGFMSAVINADNLLVMVTTAFLLSVIRLTIRGPSMTRVLASSTLACAAVLTHGRGLITIPVLVVACIVAWIRFRPGIRDTLLRGAVVIGSVVGAFGIYLALASASSGGSLYGGEVSSYTSGSFNLRQFLSSIYQFYFPRLQSLRPRLGPEYGYRQVFINTFYATFGSLEVTFRQRVYDVLQVLSALGLVAFYTACVAKARQLSRAWPVVAVMLTLLLTTLFFLHYASYRALLGDGGSDPLIVGRYLLPLISLYGVAIAFTIGSLPRRAGVLIGAVLVSVAVLFSLASIGITAVRFYV